MTDIFKYKGYYTKIKYSTQDKLLYGKIEGIDDEVLFDSTSAEDIENEFHQAVDEYLEFCAEVGKEPDKAYSGSFNVRVSPSVHKKAAQMAFRNGESLNQLVERAVNDEIEHKHEKNMSNIIRDISRLIARQGFEFSRAKIQQPKQEYWKRYNNVIIYR